jgi:DNA invertase Pin-like site-specific DNA recombinase
MWQMIGVLTELEPSLISERTRAGVKAAKVRGVKFGRKRKLTPQQVIHTRKLIDDHESPRAVAAGYGVSRATLYRALAERLGSKGFARSKSQHPARAPAAQG